MTGILGLPISGYILRLFSSVLENINYFNYDVLSIISKKNKFWVWLVSHFNKNINCKGLKFNYGRFFFSNSG